MEAILELQDLTKYFPVNEGSLFRRKHKILKAVDRVSFSIEKGTSFGIAGESGSGKTTIAKLILMLEKATSGSILLEGKNISRFTRTEVAWYRTRVQAVFQDAASFSFQ
jgi:ABC-type oligopeptide transport system ATPase subunit